MANRHWHSDTFYNITVAGRNKPIKWCIVLLLLLWIISLGYQYKSNFQNTEKGYTNHNA